MRSLFEPITPFAAERIEVGGGHSIHVEQAGNSRGIPVLFLHGGPGSGCNENHRRYFSPDQYRVVLFDQRGCNRSTPGGETRSNTTQLLLRDMETIRERAGVDKWLLFGGSWGSTLALLYAETFPERVRGMILRGVFLARTRDLEWLALDGANRIFPDAWQIFLDAVAPAERNDPLAACERHILGSDQSLRRHYALAWSRWAGRVATYLLPEPVPAEQDEETIIRQAQIEMHYARHRYFLADNQVLENAATIPAVPVRIIHGRRDLTCTLEASWALREKLSGAELVIVPDGGHLASEPAMVDALVTATDAMAARLK
ncbi:MAG: prolyl aminopeptidase [Gammaproteobacteria bacterium]|nr:prolyl aminopeptidase [Gammaproteobacteria bacterium]